MAGLISFARSGAYVSHPQQHFMELTMSNFTINVTLNQQEAEALAQLCKRMNWERAREISTGESEIHAVFFALARLREALAGQGIEVR